MEISWNCFQCWILLWNTTHCNESVTECYFCPSLLLMSSISVARTFLLQLQTAWRGFLGASWCGESPPGRSTRPRSDWSMSAFIRAEMCCINVNVSSHHCRCTALHHSQCSWTSCIRRWRESFHRLTAGWDRTYEPWRTVTLVMTFTHI